MSELALPDQPIVGAGLAPALLRDVYAAMADLWCSPQDVDMDGARKGAAEVIAGLNGVDPQGAGLLARFLENPVSEEEYVELFELNPQCSLYLGSHVFAEPQSCAQAGVSDRNGYMIELLGIYRHLGLSPNGKELPDYLPLVVEFLSLAVDSADPIREKLIKEYILPYLPPLRTKLAELKTPYVHLLDALERVLKLDVASEERVSHV
ncbi:MAG: nitrate reductase molybdenum cofactor assembly chaperone [Chloroflexi bacterium]|nr:nitrate reductase molybdenum cofactor assembly chaperone [Chloroflexota bacterium]